MAPVKATDCPTACPPWRHVVYPHGYDLRPVGTWSEAVEQAHPRVRKQHCKHCHEVLPCGLAITACPLCHTPLSHAQLGYRRTMAGLPPAIAPDALSPAVEQARRDHPDAPLVDAYRSTNHYLLMWCPSCCDWHGHAPDREGWHAAKCFPLGSRYAETGYILYDAGRWNTEARALYPSRWYVRFCANAACDARIALDHDGPCPRCGTPAPPPGQTVPKRWAHLLRREPRTPDAA